MRRINTIALIVFTLFTAAMIKTEAQNWQLVWSDEFNGTTLDATNWNIELGNGIGGWGTGQVDYCTANNLVVANGTLSINLKKESINGVAGYYDGSGKAQYYNHTFSYTSGKIDSKAKQSFHYGKIEARCKIPKGLGLGAAFWMLGSNTDLVGWPKCGEIDILETNGNHIYTNNSTVHWQFVGGDGKNYHGSKGASDSLSALVDTNDLSKNFHIYKILWVQDTVKMYLDNFLVNTIKSSDLYGAANPFNASDFYIILSTGVGSQFSGSVIDDSSLPTAMVVDYVRVYKDANKDIHIPGKIEAENFATQYGTVGEACSDAGGGIDQGFIDANDWLKFNVTVDLDTNYKVTYRVAGTGVGEIQLKSNGTLLKTTAIPSSGGWQTWQDVVTYVHLPKGTTSLQTLFSKAGFNINNVKFEIYNGAINNVNLVIDNNSSIAIFPNPVKDLLTIQTKGNSSMQVELSDMNGKLVNLATYPNSETTNIDLSGLDKGIYIIRIITNEGVKTEKIIHQ